MEKNWLIIEKKGNEVVLTMCSREAQGEIVIPDNVTFIGDQAFSGCESISSICFPENVTSIKGRAFMGCTELEEVIIPSKVKVIGFSAFSGCENLKSIAIPDQIEEIGEHAFYGCSKLEELSFYKVPDSKLTPVKGIIQPFAFQKCNLLKKIAFPDTIKIIERNAFYELYKLEEMSFPASVEMIGRQEGFNCHLSTLVFKGTKLPDTNRAFERCSIKELRVNIPYKERRTIPQDIVEALHLDNPRERGSVVFAAPGLCNEPSMIPGYIKATLTKNDEFVDINTRYIVSVEPIKIERFMPVTGSRITCASFGNAERFHQIDVYEPCESINKKISLSLEQLGQQVGGAAGLLNQLETLLCKSQGE